MSVFSAIIQSYINHSKMFTGNDHQESMMVEWNNKVYLWFGFFPYLEKEHISRETQNLSLLIKGHDHHCCSIALHTGCFVQEVSFSFLQTDTVNNTFPLTALQTGLDYREVRWVDTQRNLGENRQEFTELGSFKDLKICKATLHRCRMVHISAKSYYFDCKSNVCLLDSDLLDLPFSF